MTTDKYTPTDEDIRECWEEAWQAGDRSEQFDRWLTAHDTEAKAEALDEAADGTYVAGATVGHLLPLVRSLLHQRAAEYRTPKETP